MIHLNPQGRGQVRFVASIDANLHAARNNESPSGPTMEMIPFFGILWFIIPRLDIVFRFEIESSQV
jgi:hypothetical protein